MTLFGTAGIRGSVAETVTPTLALRVGQAVGEDGEEFVVGRDGRETGAALAAAVEAGLVSAGADVHRVGVVPTPAVAYASQGRRGVMVTASHNPPADNGIKLFVDGEEYDREGEERVSGRVDDGGSLAPWDEFGDATHSDVLEEYREAVVAFVRSTIADEESPVDDPADGAETGGDGIEDDDGGIADTSDGIEDGLLTGVTVAVDCGTGMGSVATPQVLRVLGADVRALNANVDGHFPARASKPKAETLGDLSQFVRESDVDLGLAHDGDADRIVVLAPDGEVVHEDTVLAILAEHYVRASDAADPVVVTTPNASARIDERVDAAGGRTERVRLGALHEGIARERARGGDDTEVAFAAEPWKHVHTAFGGWIDGVASAGVLSALVARDGSLAALRDSVRERPYRKVSVSCPDAAKAAAVETLEGTLPAAFEEGDVDTDYGVRVDLPDGSWVLVRPSGTEPYVRIYAESDDVDALVATARDVVESAVETAQS